MSMLEMFAIDLPIIQVLMARMSLPIRPSP
jgi:hypothetical protein